MARVTPMEAWRRLSAFLLEDSVESEAPLPDSVTEEWLLESAETLLARPDSRVFSRWLESWPLPGDVAAEYGSALTDATASLPDLLTGPSPGDGSRVGLLTDVRVLQAKRTITTRGDFILRNLYCVEVGSPPPDLEMLPPPAAGQSQRDRLAELVEPVSCRGCHQLLDPLGYSLERFGPDGEWRELDNGSRIDTSGTMTTPLGFPLSFMGIHDLAERMTESCEVSRCVARKLFALALERAHGYEPWQAYNHLENASRLDPVAAHFYGNGARFRALIDAIVLSPEFLGDPEPDSAP